MYARHLKLLIVYICLSCTLLCISTPSSVMAEETILSLVISIEGLSDEQQKNALAYLEINENRDNPQLDKLWLKQLHLKAEQNIQQSLHPFGYYNAIVKSSLEYSSKKIWQASYIVSPGNRIQFSNVQLQISGDGENDPKIVSAKNTFPIKNEDFLDHDMYEAAKLELLSFIGNQGYVNAKIEKKQLIINPENNTAQLILHINTGQQFFLGEFRFHQNSIDADLLQRYIVDVNSGDFYSQKSLLSLQQALISSGYFSVVDIKPEFDDSSNQQVPIDITLQPIKRHKLSFGLGYDTEIDLHASIRWQNRLFNSAGHNTDASLKLSNKVNTLKGTYWMPTPAYDWLPGTNPRSDKIGLSTQFETESVNATERQTFDLNAAYIFKFREMDKDWNSKLFVEYKFESYETGDIEDSNSNLLSFGARMEGFFYESGLYPRRGWALSAEVRGTPGEILSSTRYLRLHLKSKVILPVMKSGRLMLRGELGLAQVNDFEKYPSSLRFYAGGDQSVRGYNWKSLGPNIDGDIIGGKNIISTSLEYNHKVAEKWAIAAFADAGNAYNNSLDKIYYGAGIGGRWISPVGLLRVDLGWPINDDENVADNESPVLYFGFEVSL